MILARILLAAIIGLLIIWPAIAFGLWGIVASLVLLILFEAIVSEVKV